MRYLVLFFLLFGFVQIKSIGKYSVPALERLVNLQYTNTKISVILEKMTQQTGVVFSYSEGAFINSSIDVIIQQKSVRFALKKIFGDKVIFTVNGKYIILKKSDIQVVKNVKKKIIEGYITDPASNSIISNATIYDETLVASAITDKYGYFKIELPENKDSIKLHIRKEGYNEIVIQSNRNEHFLDVPLNKRIENIVYILDSAGNRITKSLQNEIPKWLISNRMLENTSNLPDTFWRKTQFSVLPYIGTNKLFSGNFSNDYSFNLLAGYVYEVRKVELGGVLNIVRTNARFLQAAGVGNIVGGTMKGFQTAGTFNYTYNLEGIQSAGSFNVVRNNAIGLQSAGFSNFTLNKIKGFQFAGVINLAGNVDGLQAAGAINIAYKNANGWFAAGIANYCNDTLLGHQFAGVVNISKQQTGYQVAGVYNTSKDIRGAQVSGLVNVADSVRGAQITSVFSKATYIDGYQLSLISISDSCKGLPIGLFSYVKNGYRKFEVSIDELRLSTLSFRTGNHLFHNIFSFGFRTEELNKATCWSFGYGIGTSFYLNNKNYLDLELSNLQFGKANYFTDKNNLYKVDVGIDHKLFNKVSFAYGLSFNVYIASKGSNVNEQALANISPYAITDNTLANSKIKTWIGAKVALRFF